MKRYEILFTIIISIFSAHNILAASAAAGGGIPAVEETSTWVPTLNYYYNGQAIRGKDGAPDSDHAEDWHRARVKVLQDISKILMGQNAAFMKVDLVYEDSGVKDGCNLRLVHYDVPCVFLSGWNSRRLGRDRDTIVGALLSLLAPLYTGHPLYRNDRTNVCFVGSASEEVTDIGAYVAHLKTLYGSENDRGEPHRSASARINGKMKELDRYASAIEEEGDKESSTIKEFAARFNDAEQAGFLKLCNLFKTSTMELGELIAKVPEKAKIRKAVVHVATHHDVCLDCSDTAFVQMEAVQGFVQRLKDYLGECSGRYNTSSLSYNVFVSSVNSGPTTKLVLPGWSSRAYGTEEEKHKMAREYGLYEEGMLLLDRVPPQLPLVLQKNLLS